MTRSEVRRQLLKSALGMAAVAGPWGSIFAGTDAASPALQAQKLAGPLTLFTGAGGNVVACRDAQGLALVDGGATSRSRELLKLVARETGSDKVHTLFNTHWHPDQTGSNQPLGEAGARIIAHENTRLWLTQANPVPPGNHLYGPLPPKARPSRTFYYNSEQLSLGDEPVVYGYLMQAHTDGDIYVHFRNSNVLVTGGPVAAPSAGWPVIDIRSGGWIMGMIDALRTLAGLADEHTLVVPANGPVLTRADLLAQQKMYGEIAGQLQRFLRQGLGPDEAVAHAPAAAYEAQWGDSKYFVDTAFRSLWGHMAPDA
jgi:cyclase